MGSYNLAQFILQGVRRTPTCLWQHCMGQGWERGGVAQGHKVWEGNESFSKVNFYMTAPDKCPSHQWIPDKFVKDEDEIVYFLTNFPHGLLLLILFNV